MFSLHTSLTSTSAFIYVVYLEGSLTSPILGLSGYPPIIVTGFVIKKARYASRSFDGTVNDVSNIGVYLPAAKWKVAPFFAFGKT